MNTDTPCTEGSHLWGSDPNQPGVAREVCEDCGAMRSGVAALTPSRSFDPGNWTPHDRYTAAALTGLLARGVDTVPGGVCQGGSRDCGRGDGGAGWEMTESEKERMAVLERRLDAAVSLLIDICEHEAIKMECDVLTIAAQQLRERIEKMRA